jgi:hypothetical protein
MAISTSTLGLTGSVGAGGANREADVLAIQGCLQEIREMSFRGGIALRRPDFAGGGSRSEISRAPTGVCDDITIDWIKDFQSLFLRLPDGVVEPDGQTQKLIARWAISPIDGGVQWHGNLRQAWNMLSPLLPVGSRCTSAYRSADDQRRIIDDMFTKKYATELRNRMGARHAETVKATGDGRYQTMVKELRALGQAVALPGHSPHQRGKAIDIGGPSTIDNEQVRIAKLVAQANPGLFSGKILKERNGCVHVELK